jgi:hypothetical protein
MATSDDEKFVSNYHRGMEPPGARSAFFLIDRNFFPAQSFKIKNPKIVEICNSLASKNYQIRKNEFSRVISSLPRRGFVF